jgi:aryl-alcohol dehydrogenase-like predicted oxidoreductase
MGYGDPKWTEWGIQEKDAIELIGEIYKRGINFFDTADCYSNGQSEIILGKAIKQLNMNRGRLVIATKAALAVHDDMSFNFAPRDDPNFANRFGTSRKHLFDAVDASLKRLDLDYIDLVGHRNKTFAVSVMCNGY